MSRDDFLKLNVTKIAAVLGAVLVLYTLAQGWPGLPDKVDDLQKRTVSLEERAAKNEVTLARIDEGVKYLRETQAKAK